MVRDRRKSARSIASSVEIHGEEVAADAQTFFAGKLKAGEAMPCLLLIFQLLIRVLLEATDNLVAAAARHLAVIDGDDKARRRRDELSRRLELKGRRLRDVLDALFGPGTSLAFAGLENRSAREPVDLLAQTERILDRFEGEGPEVEERELGGFVLDSQALVEDLRPDYEELSELVEHLGREDRKSDATLIAKDEAMEEYDRIFRLSAGILVGFYSLAGHEELARRIVPSVRRAGRTQVDEEADATEKAAAGEQPAAVEAEASA